MARLFYPLMFLRRFYLLLVVPLPLLAAGKLEFNRDVRPILSDRCFQCHGGDEAQRKGGLRLDLLDSATKPAKSGEVAIVPGKPEASELIKRVMLTAADDDVMPPAKLHKDLSASEKAVLKQWISEGAEYAGHWAFLAPKRPEVPGKTGSPIDAFIAQRLAKEGLSFSQEATPEALLRRLSLDLIGLPPTPEETAAFAAQCRAASANPRSTIPDSVLSNTIDRLLRSPHYGEKMAMQWLDYARFADSHGFQTDSSRSQWPWRDWVIEAFNSNKGFDAFTIEQLAGDLLPNATRDQVIATGFNRNHRLNGEGGLIAEEWRIENIIDRVETTGMTWMALTFNCCRCHDHKFDPISQKDFYAIFAFFNNVPESGTIQGPGNRSGGNMEPAIDVPNAEQTAKLTELDTAVASTATAATEAAKQLPQLVAAWEQSYASGTTALPAMWNLLQPVSAKSINGATLTRQPDASYLASGPNPPTDTYEIVSPVQGGSLSAVLLECLPDASMANQSLGRAHNGNFVLTGVEVAIRDAAGKDKPLKVTQATATYSQKGYEIASLAKAKAKGREGWAIDGNTRRDKTDAMFLLAAATPVPQGSVVVVKLTHGSFPNHNIGRFRLSSSSLAPSALKLVGGNALAAVDAILKTPQDKRSAKQNADLAAAYRSTIDSPVKRADDAHAAAKAAVEAFKKTLPTVMVMAELPQPRDAFILTRGEYDKPAGKVTAALPASLPAMPAGQPMNRLGLARWMVSGEHPLTARVWVNRQWEKFYGTGIVKTVENFGMQAEYPTHPELLDWLATEFVRTGWDMKAIQKQIVMSRAYRQSSTVSKALLERDPDNRLLARGPRFRLSGELMRDQALAVSGLLVPKLGGPSVRPFMPEGVWDETSKYGDLRGYKADTGEGLYRRTLYTIWKRTAAPPTMLLFDSPTREICTVKRSRTNTPLQALALLNETTYIDAARALAAQMLAHGGSTPQQRIAWAMQRVASRPVVEAELSVLTAGLAKRLAFYQTYPAEAAKLVGATLAKGAAAELAAYAMTANVLLNLDEVVTRQ